MVGHGLANMRVRAENLNGTFELKSAPGKGTSIAVSMPI
jgi:signal transduction histidine kinase